MEIERRDPLEEFLHPHGRVLDLRPMSVGSILDITAQTYRQVGWSLLKNCLPGTLLVFLGVAITYSVLLPNALVTRNASSVETQAAEVAVLAIIGFLLAMPQVLIGLSMISAHATHSVWTTIQPSRIRHLIPAERAFWPLVKLAFLIGLLGLGPGMLTILIIFISAFFSEAQVEWASILSGGLGVIGCIISAATLLYVIVYQALAPTALVSEKLTAAKAMKRSKQLLSLPSGSGSSMLGGLFLVGLVFFSILSGGLMLVFEVLEVNRHLEPLFGQQPAMLLLYQIFLQLPNFVALWLVLPFWGVCSSLTYIEARVRSEGYDITLLNEELRGEVRA